ncbi:MAG: PEP/pyruvate-binding domain-containing protein [Caulobacteraceae bacterium]
MSGRDGGMLWLGPRDPSEGVTAEIAGSKAEGIWRIGRLGLPTPPAFVLPTTLCAAVNADPANAAAKVAQGLRAGIERLEAATGRTLGDARAPLLVSVRSGAAKSMPGMLSTVLNVGLNARTVHGLIRLTGDPRFAWDSYRRFIESYAVVVGGVSGAAFARRLAQMVEAEEAADESELDGEALERLVGAYGDLGAAEGGPPAPDDPMDQLTAAALAVFRSWEARKAVEYRRMNGLEALAGTAVTVQAMVFGNAGLRSGSGVAFSRDPATGERGLYVDFLFDAQGEDVVSGRRTPVDAALLRARLPDAFAALEHGVAALEADRRDVQDVEFTIEDGRIYFLQTRSAKRTPRAALRVAVDLVREGVIDPATALERLAEVDLDRTAATRFSEPVEPVATAIPASPGVASGRAALASDRAKAMAEAGDPVILVRAEPSTEDIEGFAAAQGILTAVGGRTAHAAVVARQLGKVCLVGCRALVIDPASGAATLNGQPLREGDWLSLDGEAGTVGLGRREVVVDAPRTELEEVARWRKEAPVSGAKALQTPMAG